MCQLLDLHRLVIMRDEALIYSTAPGTHDGTVVMSLVGPLTLSNMFGLQDELRALKPQVLILDLSGSPYMDSAGLGLLMNCYVAAEGAGRKFFLTGVNNRVTALLDLTKVTNILKTFASVEAAEASL
jgi:anti-anti-sigma factor